MKALKILVLVCVLAVSAFFGCNFLFMGRFTFPSEAEYEAIAKSGQPIAQAICDYRSEHGLLPLVLADIVPTYLPKAPQPGWWFDGDMLRHNAGIPRSYITYSFVGEGGWVVWGQGINHRLNAAGPASRKPVLTNEGLFTAQLAEYERRISHHPDNSYYNSRAKGYYEDKISFLGLAKRQDLLRAECERDAKRLPNWWLPEMVLAESDELNTDAERRFVTWVHEHGTFVNYWYLARYYRDKSDTNAALAALEQAATSPYEYYAENARWGGTAYSSDAAEFSYGCGKYDLTLRLCHHCESVEGSMEGQTLLEYVAAAELKLMQFDSAIAKAQRVVDIANQHPMEVHVDVQNLPALLAAAKAHDTNFVSHFSVPSADSEFSLFVKPSP